MIAGLRRPPNFLCLVALAKITQVRLNVAYREPCSLPHIFLQSGLSDISPNQLVVGTTLAPEAIRNERIAPSA